MKAERCVSLTFYVVSFPTPPHKQGKAETQANYGILKKIATKVKSTNELM